MNKILYVVATPIGNLDDVSPRVIETLKKVDYILAEDTRHSKILLDHFGIHTPCISLHKYNEMEKLDNIAELFNKNFRVAIISDAGTPAISDPGSMVIEYSLNNHVKVVPIPGPSALSTLLSVSSIQKGAVTFVGFLPHKKSEKKKFLAKTFSYLDPPHAVMFFESPLRILGTLKELAETIPDATVIIGRELTKLHEEILKFQAKDFPQDIKEKGEFTILVKIDKVYELVKNKDQFEKKSEGPKKISAMLADYLKISPKKAYDLLMDIKKDHLKD